MASSFSTGNVYAYLPRTIARDLSIVLMVLHQVIVFALFSFPLYFMAEKALGVHSGPLWKRYAARLPVGLLLWLIALAIPFFGVINDVLGAFTTTFETFIIPPLVYNVLYFHCADAAANRDAAPKPPGRLLRRLGGWTAIKWFNWGISKKRESSGRKGGGGGVFFLHRCPTHHTLPPPPLPSSHLHCRVWIWHGRLRLH